MGELNYKYFMTFLFVNSLTLIYYAYALGLVLFSEIYRRDLFNATFKNRNTGEIYQATYWMLFNFLLNDKRENMVILVLMMLAGVMGVTIFFFMLYHVYLIACGKTTNESFKWDSVKYAYKQLVKAHENYKKNGSKSVDAKGSKESSSAIAGAENKKDYTAGAEESAALAGVLNDDASVGCVPGVGGPATAATNDPAPSGNEQASESSSSSSNCSSSNSKNNANRKKEVKLGITGKPIVEVHK